MSRLNVVRGMFPLVVALTAAAMLDARTAVAAEGEADPMAISLDLAWATFAVFVLLFLVLRKFAWGPLTAALDAREKRIADHILAAEQAQEEAKKLLAEHEAKLAAAQEEVRALIEKGRLAAEHTQQEILAKAHAEAQAELARATHEITTARDQALNELSRKSADLAVELAGHILRKKLDASEHAALIKDAMEKSVSAARSN